MREGMNGAGRMLALMMILIMTLCSAAAGETISGENPLRGYDEKEKYQYVLLGTYPYEADGTVAPLLWRVLDVEENSALLLTENVIDVQQAIFVTDKQAVDKHDYRRVTDYMETDLPGWMNAYMFPLIFGEDPMAEAVMEEARGWLYCLTDKEYLTAKYGFSTGRFGVHKERIATGTPYAKSVKLTSWAKTLYADRKTKGVSYWIAEIKNATEVKMGIVGYDGHLSFGAYSRTNIGVRPALRLDLTLCEIVGGSGTKEDPFILGRV